MPKYDIKSISCNASKDIVYEIISDTSKWPQRLKPCLNVRVIESSEGEELVEVTALINENRMTWRSHRKYLRDEYMILAKIVDPMPFVKFMSVEWRVVALNCQKSLLILEHYYEVEHNGEQKNLDVKTYEDAEEFIKSAIEKNSIRELNDIKYLAENIL